MDRWEGRTAVVTGASEGIGAAIVRRLVKEGMHVAALARREQPLKNLEEEIMKSGLKGRVKGYKCDVSSLPDVEAAFKGIEKDFGAVSVLVNNAGVFKMMSPTELQHDGMNQQLDINLKGLLQCTNAAVASMKKNSINDGHIINMSSVAGHSYINHPGATIYSATKSGVNMFSKGLKHQLLQEGLKTRVSNMSPGLVDTPMAARVRPFLQEGQYLLPEDIADSVAYALSAPPRANISEITIEPVNNNLPSPETQKQQ